MNFRIFLILFSVFYVSFASAVPVKDLYRASIELPATDSEEQMLNDAFAQAVQQVLVRVCGDQAAITGDVLAEAQKAAPTWVAQHSVVSLSDLLPSNGGLVAGKQVNVVFYHESIDQFLSKHGLPVWGDNRPSVLIWAVDEKNGQRVLSGAKAPSELLNDIASSAAKAGVPVYAPLVDSVDSSVISSSDVWGFFEDTIKAASERYQTDAVAALRVSQYADSVSGSLLVMVGKESTRFSLSGSNLQELVDQASADLAKTLSARYAAVRSNASQSRLKVQVSGVSNYPELHKVQQYLESIGVVRDVYVVDAGNNLVTFSVAINGDKQKLLDSISLSSMLQADTIPKPITNQNTVVSATTTADAEGQSSDSVDVPSPVTTTGESQAGLTNNIEYFKYNGAQ